MAAHLTARRVFAGFLLLGASGCLLAGLVAATPPGGGGPAGESATALLGGPERFLTHVSTDKPIYRAGEHVYVRGVILGAADRKPLPAETQTTAVVEIKGPKGDTVASGYVASQESVLGFDWTVPDGQPGGEYTIKVSFPFDGHAPAERKFDIRAYRAPRLKSQIVFLRDGYGPGDAVSATLHVERAEGGIPAGAAVTAIARVDGAEAFHGAAAIDEHGNCTVQFELPVEIARGEGTLALVIEDGGVVETAAKTIPILLQTVDLSVYPEGGDLVAGLPTRIYLEGRTPAQKPADIAGVVLNDARREVAHFRTEHEGRGRFDFTPARGGRYLLKITEPAGIATTYPLPEVKDSGAVLSATDDLIAAGEPAMLKVGGTAGGEYTVSVRAREVELAAAKIELTAGEMGHVELALPEHAGGVLVVTVWGPDGKPLAERLLFRQPDRNIHVQVTSEKATCVPGDVAKLNIKTTDDAGQPVPAVVGLTVTDDSVLEMIEHREQAPRLGVMVLLEDEVRELADATVYLDPTDPRAPLALDLLLGTQGWRRFALVDPENFLAAHGDAARRALALRLIAQGEESKLYRFFFLDRDGVNGVERFGAPALGIENEQRVQLLAEREVADQPVSGPAEPRADADEQLGAEAVGAGGRRLRQALAKVQDQVPLLAADAPRESQSAARNDFVLVRQYAHELRPGWQPGDRLDFSETLYWNAGVKTDAQTGEASVSFALCDAVTTFRVFADAFTLAGALGQGTAAVEAVTPFYVEPKLPLEVTAGDVVRLPIGIVNATAGDLAGATVTVKAAGGEPTTLGPLVLGAGERRRQLFQIDVPGPAGVADVAISAEAGGFADRVTRTMAVQSLGFPASIAYGGMLGPASRVWHVVEIPEQVVPGSVHTNIALYPTPLANMTGALERLIQEPSGCFEQTTSTTYPLVMAQQYFQSHTGVEPQLIERSNDLLGKGYDRLVSFECSNKGFEWFGEDPGHEALTAFGLLEFTDMSHIRQVEPKLLAASRAWLLKARDGKGGFTRARRALHTWIMDPDASNAYITWALLECGEKGLDPEVKWVRASASASRNSYVVALAANVLALAGQPGEARKLMDRLTELQTAAGEVGGASTSIVGSEGESLSIETTSLAVLAWLRDPAYAASAEKAIHYLAQSSEAGRFGSTQSTVLALRAIVCYDAARAHPKQPGTIRLLVDGEPIGPVVAFDTQSQGAIELSDLAPYLPVGEHKIELVMEDGSSMPYSIAVNCFDIRPASDRACKVELEAVLSDVSVEEGAVTEAHVTVTNRTDAPVPTPVAIIGVPGGLEVRHEQLKELVKSHQIDAYEVRGREVVLYWRELKAGQKVELAISLVGAIPGTYTGPASRAYLYYADEFKHWVEGLRVEITPRKGR